MAQGTTLILLPETSYVNPGDSSTYTVSGDANPAAAYYIGTKNLQTVNIRLTGVIGDVFIQATLADEPTENDWFDVYGVLGGNEGYTASTTVFTSYTQPFVTSLTEGSNVSTTSAFANISGSFVYMRASVRNFQAGIINYIKLSY